MSKEAWTAAKAEVEAIEKERDALVAPTQERYRSACEKLEQIEEESGEAIGQCEYCMEPIFDGDPYLCCEDGHLCRECAPSWRDMRDHPEQFVDTRTDEAMSPERAQTLVDAHLAAGGSLDDKMVS